MLENKNTERGSQDDSISCQWGENENRTNFLKLHKMNCERLKQFRQEAYQLHRQFVA